MLDYVPETFEKVTKWSKFKSKAFTRKIEQGKCERSSVIEYTSYTGESQKETSNGGKWRQMDSFFTCKRRQQTSLWGAANIKYRMLRFLYLFVSKSSPNNGLMSQHSIVLNVLAIDQWPHVWQMSEYNQAWATMAFFGSFFLQNIQILGYLGVLHPGSIVGR